MIERPAIPTSLIIFEDYTGTFVQRIPCDGVKQKNGTWKTKKKSLSDRPIQAHLDGQYYVGVRAQWYPKFCVLDIDDRKPREALDIQL